MILNGVDLLYLLIGVQGLLLGVFLIGQSSFALRFIGLMVTMIGIDAFSHIQLFHPYLHLINHGNLFALGPLLYLSWQSLSKTSLVREYIWHIVPFILLKVVLVYVEITQAFIPANLSVMLSFLMVAYNLSYSVRILFVTPEERKRKEFRNLYKLNVVFFVGWVFALLARLVEPAYVSLIFWRLAYGTAGLLIYYFAYRLMATSSVFKGQSYAYKTSNKKKDVLQLLNEERIFRNPEINRGLIASELELSEHELSFILNQEIKQPLNDLINSRRIAYCQDRLTQNYLRNQTILAIGMESGFGSKATFQRAFKKYTGCTPNEYLKKEGLK